MLRKAALSKWLQRKLKPSVEAAVAALQQQHSGSSSSSSRRDGVLWCLLHLMSGRQIAAAVAVAVGVGDVRLATVLAAAGQAAAARQGRELIRQLQVGVTWRLIVIRRRRLCLCWSEAS
jgi:Mrp family chromosome partitioning ATPase